MRTLAVGLLTVALLTACSEPAPTAPPRAAPDAAPSAAPTATPTTSEPPERRFVPKVKGQRLVDARAHLVRRGFRVEVNTIEMSACVRHGLVLRQDPPPRYIRNVGSKVTLGVNRGSGARCGLDLPPAPPVLQAAGESFVEFARGGPADEHLLRTPVRLYLGGRLLHTIPAWRAVHRNSYGWLCPAAGSYAARTCPFSSTRTIRGYPGPMAVTGQPPQHPCSVGGTLAEKRASTVTLTPDEPRDCFSYFAVELEVAADGRLVAVNLILSEP